MTEQTDNNTGIAIWVQCHICKEWHKLEPDEITLYVDLEHDELLWTCPECIE